MVNGNVQFRPGEGFVSERPPTRQDIVRGLKQKVQRARGGTSTPRPTPREEPKGKSQAEINQIKTEAKQSRLQFLQNARTKFTQDIRNAVGIEGRRKALQTLTNSRIIANAQEKASLVSQGLLKSFKFRGSDISKGNIKDFNEQIKEFLVPKKGVPTGSVIDVFREKDFGDKVETPLTTRLRGAILKLPGGSTILRNLQAGKETLIDIEKRFPTLKTLAGKQKQTVPEGFVDISTEKGFTPSGRGTIIKEPLLREQTLVEGLGISDDRATDKLKENTQKIQDDFLSEKIDEQEANKRLEGELKRFETSQSVKNLPKNIAIGVAVGAISTIPVLGQVVGGGFIGAALLQRRQIVSRAKRFPTASAIDTAGFLAGGLAGTVIKGKITSKLSNNIKPADIKSVTGISGKEKSKLLTTVKENINPKFRELQQSGKITGTIAYEMKLSDGRVIKVVQFNKLTATDITKGLSGEKQFIGFEVAKKGVLGEKLFGRGIERISGTGKGETFTRVLRFKPANTKISRALQKFGFKQGRKIDILQKSKITGTFQKKGGSVFRVETEARTLSDKSVGFGLQRRINSIQKKIDTGKKVGSSEVRNLINLERRLNNLKPFTSKEFNKAGLTGKSTVSDTVITRLVKNAKKTVEVNFITEVDSFGRVIKLRNKEDISLFGVSITKGKKTLLKKKPTPKKRITKSEFNKKVGEISRKSRGVTNIKTLRNLGNQLATLEDSLGQKAGILFDALKNKINNKIVQRFGTTAVIAEAVKKPFQPSIVPGAVPGVTSASAFAFVKSGFGSARVPTTEEQFIKLGKVGSTGILDPPQRIFIAQENFNKNKLEVFEGQIKKFKLKLKDQLKFGLSPASTNLTRTLISNAIKSAQAQRQLLKLAQKLKQRQRTQQRSRQKIGVVALSILPILPSPLGLVSKKKKVKVVVRKKARQGYNAFAKARKKFIKLNKVPLSKRKARDMSAFFVDNTLSATGLIKKTIAKAMKPKLKVPSNYFRKTKNKYRLFKIKAGKRVPLKNKFIEKRRFRLDRRNESQTIQALRRKIIKRSKLKTSKMVKRRRKKK